MTNQFSLTDDQIAIQDVARKFTSDRITPFAGQWDEEHHYPVDVWKAAGELGFGAIYISEENGGIGLGRWVSIETAVEGSHASLMVELRQQPTLLGNLLISRILHKKLSKWLVVS